MAAELYHGSKSRTLAYRYFFNPINRAIRAVRLKLKGVREDPAAVALVKRAEQLIATGDVAAARTLVREAADLSDRNPRVTTTFGVGSSLMCLGDCGRGLRLMAPHVKRGDTRTWTGQDLSDATLIVRQRIRSDMGAAVRLARFIGDVQKSARRCVVVAEGRLVPLFQRSFPGAEVVSMDASLPRIEGKVYEAVLERVASFYATDWTSIETTFKPLKADEAVASTLRQKYRAAAQGPIIGITWGSRNARKGMPDLDAWAHFVQNFPATFVSLQYGEVDAAVAKLTAGKAQKLIEDETVDQMKDMDRFAAQIMALDAVIGVSNTAAYLAGALDVPLVVVRDDRFGMYPVEGDRTGWFPQGTLIRKRQRPWSEVLDEAAVRLTQRVERRAKAQS